MKDKLLPNAFPCYRVEYCSELEPDQEIIYFKHYKEANDFADAFIETCSGYPCSWSISITFITDPDEVINEEVICRG